jgi:hypothetical protein
MNANKLKNNFTFYLVVLIITTILCLKIKTMKAIINRNSNFGTLNGVITENSKIQSEINKGLKNGTAKKLVDTDSTLMYLLKI